MRDNLRGLDEGGSSVDDELGCRRRRELLHDFSPPSIGDGGLRRREGERSREMRGIEEN